MRRALPKVVPDPLMKLELLDYSKGINSFDANDVVRNDTLRQLVILGSLLTVGIKPDKGVTFTLSQQVKL